MMRRSYFLIAITLLMISQLEAQKRFSLLSPEESGVAFRNDITSDDQNNIFIYEAFFNGGGVAIGDINNDDLPDIYFAGNQVADQLYLNKGDMQFEEISLAAGIQNRGGWSTGVIMLDINGDGLKDIFVCKSLYDDQPHLRVNELYINNGDLTFTESAAKYGLNDPFRAMEANFFDYDKDGDFDLFLINQPPNPGLLSPMKDRNWLSPDLTYRFLENQGGKFEDITGKVGLENVGYGLSSTISDFNNDGWLDIYVANDYEAPDFFYINNGDRTFTNKIDDLMGHISFFSMGTDAADINNDGWMDLTVVDMVSEDNFRLKANMSGMNPQDFWNTVELGGHYQYMFNVLQLNNGVFGGQQRFSEIGQLAGMSSTDWSWTPLMADFDNNGHKDLFITNGIKMDVRNTDALKKVDKYLSKSMKHLTPEQIQSCQASPWDYLSLDSMMSFFPVQKIQNYTFSNDGNLNYHKVSEEWGLDELTFSSGAAYADLDNDGDLDLVVSNVDEVAYIYRNNTEQSEGRYLKVQLKEDGKAKSFFGTRVSAYYDGNMQMAELTGSRGFYSSSEELIHFGLPGIKKLDSLVVQWYDGGRTVLTKVKTNQRLVVDRSEGNESDQIVMNTYSIVEDITEQWGLTHEHKENDFDDYEREILLPHKMSVLGPTVAIGDADGDGHDDIFVGGSLGDGGSIYLQKAGQFVRTDGYQGYPYHEDMGATFLDIDNDGDQDLYVVSGGNEYERGTNLYQDRLYVNDGAGQYSLTDQLLPEIRISGGRVVKSDFDKDGDIDLFVAGRQVPGRYPEPAESLLLVNQYSQTGTPTFKKADIVELKSLGMVTDASWSDYDGDGDQDLLVVGEWMSPTFFENKEGQLFESSLTSDLSGWWYSITAADLDGDGDDDYILGNLGKNYKYKASAAEPFTVNYGDFDQNGKGDIILGYYNYGEHYPLRGRSCSSQQAPILANSFPTYTEFAGASLIQVYGSEFLNKSLEYKATSFASTVLINEGVELKSIELPNEVQISSINDIVVEDLNGDEHPDLIVAGNMYGAEIETARNDSGVGMILIGLGEGKFAPVAPTESGLMLPYDVKAVRSIQIGEKKGIVIGVNDGPIRLLRIK